MTMATRDVARQFSCSTNSVDQCRNGEDAPELIETEWISQFKEVLYANVLLKISEMKKIHETKKTGP